MNPTQYFTSYRGMTGGMLDWMVLGILILALVLGVLLIIERPKHDPGVHSPRMAWLRGGLYFCAIGLLAWLTGVSPAILDQPFIREGQLTDPLWLGVTGLCIGLLIWGYFYWWPRGTITHGRKRYVVASGLWGFVWGEVSALVLLSIYAILEIFGLPAAVNALLTIVVVAVYNLNYQSGWWDIHVSPPHNIRTWNNRKVLGSHNPFLIATLAHLVLFGNLGLFVLLYALALAACAIAMHFPPFWEADGPPVSYDTALGE
ncbi:MAG: hypothetical protein QNJ73_02115 [Gammaproteobacteria bacterium]|nr:hypothetical protein [Gammaproteobacteria bacterium]